MADKSSILIVDDSVELIEILRLKFQEDHLVYYALDGGEGLDKVKSLRPDLVLLDINLPNVNGFEVLNEIRSTDSIQDTAVILLTALSETENVVKGLGLGADDYIVKPFKIAELSAKIKSHIKIRNLQKQLVEMERLKTLREVAVSFSHEVNNPLMAISTFAYFLKNNLENQSDECRKSVEGIIMEAERISGIVKNLSVATNAATVEYSPGLNMINFESLTEEEG